MNLSHHANRTTNGRPPARRGTPLCKWLIWVFLLESLFAAAAAESPLGHSKHNLALGSANRIQGTSQSDMCKFCHTPHVIAADQALWNHSPSTASYIPYRSTTMKAAVGQPTGDSKLCLSCHDGTVALGMMQRRKRSDASWKAATRMAPGRVVLGTDLSDDHPVSFNYDASLTAGAELKSPSLLNNKVHLDAQHQVQCTSCHDPHNDQNGKFLIVNNYASALCLSCHDPKYWSASAHRNSPRTWNGTGRNPWTHTSQRTVSGNGCENCHAPHNAGTHQRLLNFPQAEDNCLVCHNGSVAAKNLAGEFNKPSAHPVLTTSSMHDAAENPVSFKNRHASCMDCHNPHAANAVPGVRPNVGGALAGVAGVSASGLPVKNARREYELCFRCHSESAVKGSSGVLRQSSDANLRHQFATANASYHPVLAVGKNGKVPSLIAPWTISSFVYCTDCHNNDQGPGAGGAGPKGPHGSLYAPLLEQNLVRQDFQEESPAAYALCYKCHSRASILSDASFSWHRKHVVDAKTACSTCHDAHGVAASQRLINFNTLYVKPSASKGAVQFNALGAKEKACTLSCHGVEHPVVRR